MNLRCRIYMEIKKLFLFFKKFKKFSGFLSSNENKIFEKKNFEKIQKKKLRHHNWNFWFKKISNGIHSVWIHSKNFFSNLNNHSFFFSLKNLKKLLYLQSESSINRKLFQKKNFFEKIYFSYHTQRLFEYLFDFYILDLNLKNIFPLISKGGIMEINLMDSIDPFLEGIILSVKPPEKTWKTVSYLSGGEKTLSSLAVVFSLQELKSSSWYLLDEIDAALDFRNVTKISSYLFSHSKNSQIIIVSLRNNILTNSNHILGVYKNFGETKLISFQNSEF